jgi:hypothetical protein
MEADVFLCQDMAGAATVTLWDDLARSGTGDVPDVAQGGRQDRAPCRDGSCFCRRTASQGTSLAGIIDRFEINQSEHLASVFGSKEGMNCGSL